jgi:hypothetical protein
MKLALFGIGALACCALIFWLGMRAGDRWISR